MVAYPQLKVKLELMNELLAKNPKDPQGLFERGELRLDKGERAGAVEDLHAALENLPPGTDQKAKDDKVKIQGKLFDAMTELLQHDFNNGEKYLKEYGELCTIAGGEDAAKETQRRKANYLCLVAKGREDQGKLDEALKAYLDFGSLPTAQDELLSVVTEPAVKCRGLTFGLGVASRPCWSDPPPSSRKPLEDVISGKWVEVKSSADLEKLRHFVSMFGDTAAIGKEGQLFLADRLMEPPGQRRHARRGDAVPQTHQRRRPELRRPRALDGLARLCTRKGKLEDAYEYYKTLKVRFPNTEVRDGKTGAQPARQPGHRQSRFLQYMDEPGDVVGKRRFKGELEPRQELQSAVAAPDLYLRCAERCACRT